LRGILKTYSKNNIYKTRTPQLITTIMMGVARSLSIAADDLMLNPESLTFWTRSFRKFEFCVSRFSDAPSIFWFMPSNMSSLTLRSRTARMKRSMARPYPSRSAGGGAPVDESLWAFMVIWLRYREIELRLSISSFSTRANFALILLNSDIFLPK